MNKSSAAIIRIPLIAVLIGITGVASAQDTAPPATSEADELAKQLQNPVASLVSLPLQGNYDFGIGPDDGTRFTLNVQPVVPMSLSE